MEVHDVFETHSAPPLTRYGERLEVSLLVLNESAAVGDYLIVQARAYAVEKVAAEEAREIFRLFDEFLGALPSV